MRLCLAPRGSDNRYRPPQSVSRCPSLLGEVGRNLIDGRVVPHYGGLDVESLFVIQVCAQRHAGHGVDPTVGQWGVYANGVRQYAEVAGDLHGQPVDEFVVLGVSGHRIAPSRFAASGTANSPNEIWRCTAPLMP